MFLAVAGGCRHPRELRPTNLAPHVFLLTHCHNLAQLYGSTLTFKTLRAGFPNARVSVYENASIREARPLIRAAATDAGAEFFQLAEPLQHDAWLRRVLTEYPLQGSVVILDPDLVFWSNVEAWDFGPALIAGRLIPEFLDREITGCLTVARLHTSFLWIPDVARLRDRILELEGARRFGTIGLLRLVEQTTVQTGEGLVFFDTAANLYAALRSQARPFTPVELDCYDHLFLGSHLDWVGEKTGAGIPPEHEAARCGELASIRGIWRNQESYFRVRSPQSVLQTKNESP